MSGAALLPTGNFGANFRFDWVSVSANRDEPLHSGETLVGGWFTIASYGIATAQASSSFDRRNGVLNFVDLLLLY